jgi:uncharacterized small protein (DUF1192 family)
LTKGAYEARYRELKAAQDKPQTTKVNQWCNEVRKAYRANAVAAQEYQRARSKLGQFDQALEDHNLASPEHLDQRLKELDDSIEKLEAQLQAVEALRHQTKTASPPSASSASKGPKTPSSSERPRSRPGSGGTDTYSTETEEDNVSERERNVTSDNRRRRRTKHALIRESKSRGARRVTHRASKGISHRILDKLRDLADRRT